MEGHQFHRDSGQGKSERGYSSTRRAFGNLDRFLHENRPAINRGVELLRDADKLIQIAAILGIESPVPDNGEVP